MPALMVTTHKMEWQMHNEQCIRTQDITEHFFVHVPQKKLCGETDCPCCANRDSEADCIGAPVRRVHVEWSCYIQAMLPFIPGVEAWAAAKSRVNVMTVTSLSAGKTECGKLGQRDGPLLPLLLHEFRHVTTGFHLLLSLQASRSAGGVAALRAASAARACWCGMGSGWTTCGQQEAAGCAPTATRTSTPTRC